MDLQSTIRQNSQAMQRDQYGNLVAAPVGNQLQQGQPLPSLQQLTQQAGMATPPTTPGGAGMIGANADQQKMAGTPVQKQAALQAQTAGQQQAPVQPSIPNPQQDLATMLRRQQASGNMAAGEKDKAQKLQGLGNIGDRVQAVLDAGRANLAQQTGQGAAQAAPQYVVSQTPTTPNGQPLTDAQKQALTAYTQNPQDSTTILNLNQAFGITSNAQQPLTAQQIQGMLSANPAADIGMQAQQAVGTSATVSQLAQDPSFGYSVQDLSSLLGVTPDQASKMSIQDLHDRVNQLTAQEFSTQQQTKQKIASGELGVAEIGAAQQAMRGAAVSGQATTEAQMHSLVDKIQKGDTVTFGGNQYSVEDLLNNGTISQLVGNALTNPDAMTTLQKTEPELYAFVQQHKTLLSQASDQMTAANQAFADVNKKNADQLLQVTGGIPLDQGILQSVASDAANLSTGTIDYSKVPLFAYMQQAGSAGAKNITSTLNNLQASSPELLAVIEHMSPEELGHLDLGSYVPGDGGITDTIIKQAAKSKQLSNLNPANPNNADVIIAQALPGLPGLAEAQSQLKTDKQLQNLGVRGAGTVSKTLDPNNTGSVDVNAIYGNLMKNTPSAWSLLKKAGSGLDISQNQQQWAGPPKPDASPQGVAQNDLINRFGDTLASRQLNAGDLSSLVQAAGGNAGGQEMSDLIYLKNNPATSQMATQSWQVARHRFTQQQISALVSKSNDPNTQIAILKQYMSNNDSDHVDPAEINNAISNIMSAGGNAPTQAGVAAVSAPVTKVTNEHPTLQQAVSQSSGGIPGSGIAGA